MSYANDALIGAQERKIEKLQAKNDKLRKKINALKAHGIEIADAVAGGYEIYDILQREVDRLEAKNKKLQKLCADLRFCKRHDCLTCSRRGFCNMRFGERYAELGVKVSE